MLMFARAATRENEMAVRSALGATRRRIVSRCSPKHSWLGGIAAVVGLTAADGGLWGLDQMRGVLTDGGATFRSGVDASKLSR